MAVTALSDIYNSESITDVSGSLLATGGVNGGDGGRIETSGASLQLPGLHVRLNALRGDSGLWLQDPSDYFIYDDFNIATALNSGTWVTIQTSSGSEEFASPSTAAEFGDIELTANLLASPSSDTALTLEAGGDIKIYGNIVVDPDATTKLDIVAKAGGFIDVGVNQNLESNGMFSSFFGPIGRMQIILLKLLQEIDHSDRGWRTLESSGGIIILLVELQ